MYLHLITGIVILLCNPFTTSSFHWFISPQQCFVCSIPIAYNVLAPHTSYILWTSSINWLVAFIQQSKYWLLTCAYGYTMEHAILESFMQIILCKRFILRNEYHWSVPMYHVKGPGDILVCEYSFNTIMSIVLHFLNHPQCWMMHAEIKQLWCM